MGLKENKQMQSGCGTHPKQLRLLFAPFILRWAEFNPYAARQVIAECATSCKHYLDHLARTSEVTINYLCTLLLFILKLFGDLTYSMKLILKTQCQLQNMLHICSIENV